MVAICLRYKYITPRKNCIDIGVSMVGERDSENDGGGGG